MSELVVLNLGSGNFNDGFPSVTARLGKTGNLTMQFQGSLPPAPYLPELYGRWRLLYQALYQSRARGRIEIKPGGITQVSEVEFQTLGENLGKRLNDWLSNKGFRDIEQQLRTQLVPNEAVQIIIESDDEQVWRLPWSLWNLVKEDYRYAEVALSTPEYPAPPPAMKRELGAKVKILAIFGNSSGINLQKDWQLLKKLPGVEVTPLFEPERHELTEQLWGQGWDVLFFGGHSSSNADVTEGKLFINQLPDHNSITIAELQEALHISVGKGLKLAIFNSCDGLGLPRQLAKAKVPLPPMIVMREPVPDPVAPAFLQFFFRAFADGEPFYIAVRQAKEQLKGLEHYFPGVSWLPVICQHPAISPSTWKHLQGINRKSFPATTTNKNLVIKRAGIGLLAISILYFGAGLPLAKLFNHLGVEKYHQGELRLAKHYYRLAIFLAPNYAQPHYNTAIICHDDFGDVDCATANYIQAAMRGLPEAMAELDRITLQEELSLHSLQRIERCLKFAKYDAAKASCLKNRGWSRFNEERLPEAQKDLEAAIKLIDDSPHSHCLLAQVLEKQNKFNQALKHWRKTLHYSDDVVPEQDQCIAMARKRINLPGE